ncbi:MAG TPA: hypothetical protein VG982_02415 [Candidatus Paceibacterota bacterium]|nr:hypothetical protein [Candidatus Paceibacterota bacterium]
MIEVKNTTPKWLERGLLFIGGVVATHGFSYFFDYVIYPVVTYKLGFLKSLGALFLAALFFNYILILIYDLFKKDLFGFEALKKMKADGVIAGNQKLIHRLLRWGEVPVFIALSWYDPVFAVLYKRKTTEYNGLTRRDFYYLMLSTAVGCVIWSGVWTGAIQLILQLKNLIT